MRDSVCRSLARALASSAVPKWQTFTANNNNVQYQRNLIGEKRDICCLFSGVRQMNVRHLCLIYINKQSAFRELKLLSIGIDIGLSRLDSALNRTWNSTYGNCDFLFILLADDREQSSIFQLILKNYYKRFFVRARITLTHILTDWSFLLSNCLFLCRTLAKWQAFCILQIIIMCLWYGI